MARASAWDENRSRRQIPILYSSLSHSHQKNLAIAKRVVAQDSIPNVLFLGAILGVVVETTMAVRVRSALLPGRLAYSKVGEGQGCVSRARFT